MPNSGMTLHTLVHSCDSFSLHCNFIDKGLSLSSKSNSHISLPLLRLYKSQCIFHAIQFNFVQQCIQISTRINSPMYIYMYICVCFIRNYSNNSTNILYNNSLCPKIKSMFLWYQISWTAFRDPARMEPLVWREPTPFRATAHLATPETAVTSVRPTSSINSVRYRSKRFNTENATVGEK